MTELDEIKRDLRKLYAEKRKTMHSDELDAQIAAWAAGTTEPSVFVYYSVGTEVSTRKLIHMLLTEQKKVCLPKVFNKEMFAMPYNGGVLEAGAYGIPSPRGKSLEDQVCEVAFVPLLAVDPHGNRLGYGGGYYDRYFSAHPAIKRVGLCYEGQVVPEVPHGETDMPLHAIITENGWRTL